ncbi:MAG: glycosyltransferase [bacterium]|nr:glycosyltransferase [bacterium]
MIEVSQIIPYIFLFAALYFQIFLLLTFFENREMIGKRVSRTSTHYPSVAVLVPCYNEEKTVAGTVESLFSLDYPKDKLHIVIIDDGSTDSTFEVMKTFEYHPQVTLLQKENGGKYTALNLGLSLTNTELVGCLDADSFVASNALIEIVKCFDDATIMAVMPAIKIWNPKTVLERMQKAEYDMGIFVRKMFGIMNTIQVTPGAFSLFRKRVFDELGGFKEAHNTEDMEIALRMQSNHYRIENAHMAHVYTVAPNTIRALYNQRIRWTYGFLKNVLDYRFMLFNKKYGHLGILTLPFAIASIIGAVYMAGFVVINFANYMLEKIVKFQTVGFQWDGIGVDWFFLNTQSLPILIIFTLVTTLLILVNGKKLSGGTMKPSRDILYFLLLYGLMAPMWLTKALYNSALSKKSSWK